MFTSFLLQEYIRGISSWNFNLQDLKNQAAIIKSSDGSFNLENLDNNRRLNDNSDIVDSEPQCSSTERLIRLVLQLIQRMVYKIFKILRVHLPPLFQYVLLRH
ncbi:uncharacterized protein M6B38_377320 [Iris pallida]|uniref:Uncharacterized protein n=1 Tax=Iris pallida TaxID=29817 RepID=A0AAX6GAE7_IRIPA|nr:uncharacterized protein M6B38_377320 [Iris pallida]